MPVGYGNRLVVWGDDLIEEKTREQAMKTAALPFVHNHVALMPDAHWGIGSTVGSVIPTVGAVIPAAIGVDIGCGMIACRLELTEDELPDDLRAMHAFIAEGVPAGVGKGHLEINDRAKRFFDGGNVWPSFLNQIFGNVGDVIKAQEQFGTLGSGNHFVEVCVDQLGSVWIVLHSGSRGIGNKIAKHHIEGAKGLMKRYFVDKMNPEFDLDLAYFVEDTPEFDAYIADMTWAQEYAFEQRDLMMDNVIAAVQRAVRKKIPVIDRINCHHNYTTREHHMGKNVWVTRKGAILAREGTWGVIPGSMGTETFIVQGKGYAPSFDSCSHGAGRKMGRRDAERTFTTDGLTRMMDERHIQWNGPEQAGKLLDEHPAAYKNVADVMEAQLDLCEIIYTLRQVLNYKGAS